MIPLLLPILVLAPLAQAGASLTLDPISVDWLPAACSFAPYDGDLLAVVEGEVVRIDLDALDRAPRPVDDLRLGDGSFGLPRLLTQQLDGGVAVDRVVANELGIYDARLRPTAVLSRVEATCARGIRVGEKSVVLCLGPPIRPPLGAEPRWDCSAWRREHLDPSCRLFLVDADRPRGHVPIVCDPRLASPTGIAFPDGHLLPSLDGERIYVVLEALAELIVVDARRPEIVHRSSWLKAGEAPPLVSQGDLDRQRESGIAARALRLRVDWPLGLLRWHDGERETVGVVFRRHDGDGERYVVDLFDGATGSKLADDRVLFGRLPDRSSVSPVALADGSSLLAVVPGGNDATTLFRVALDLD